MTPLRPSSAQADASPSRMSFVAAEQLLWGPELKQQNRWLLEQMRKLQGEHEAYDARIKTTEAAAEKAESAVSRIRHMEQQLNAMEAVDNDKAFEKWAAEEITRLKIFTERNQNIRQKQVELEKDVSSVVDALDRIKDFGASIRSLLRRIDLFEANLEQDADRIGALEEEVARLRRGRQSSHTSSSYRRVWQGSLVEETRSQTPRLPTELDPLDPSAETVVDPFVDALAASNNQAQDVRSHATKDNEEMISSQPLAPHGPSSSARQRLLKRPSIHNSKLPTATDDQLPVPLSAVSASHTTRHPTPPPTQLVDRIGPRKRKQKQLQLHEDVDAPVTRSQAKSQNLKLEEDPVNPYATRRPSNQSKQLRDERAAKRQRVSNNEAEEKDLSKMPTQIVPGGPSRRKKLNVSTSNSKDLSKEPTQIVTARPRKRRKPKTPRPTPIDKSVDLTADGDENMRKQPASPTKRKNTCANSSGKAVTTKAASGPSMSSRTRRRTLIVVLRYKSAAKSVQDGSLIHTADPVIVSHQETKPVSVGERAAERTTKRPTVEKILAKPTLPDMHKDTLRTDRCKSPAKGKDRTTTPPGPSSSFKSPFKRISGSHGYEAAKESPDPHTPIKSSSFERPGLPPSDTPGTVVYLPNSQTAGLRRSPRKSVTASQMNSFDAMLF